MAHILIIDDNKFFCNALFDIVMENGKHDVVCRHSIAEGIEKAREKAFDVVFLDVQLPDGNGLDALPELKKTLSRPDVIIITATGNHSGAKLAIENGAWDYIQKEDTFDRISLSLFRVLEYRKNKVVVGPTVLKRKHIIGESPALMACLDLVARAAVSDVNVLITGPTGTGKELFARAIHENSPRAEKEFVVVDCTVIPETLAESVLFGHEKGSFTGADRKQEGLIRQADHGTLFLDEIGDLPLPIQKSLLRVLQEQRFRTVGGKEEVKSDFRLISATNRDLDKMVSAGTFREDLLYRLRAITIQLPPLSERTEDIRPLTRHHLEMLYEKSGTEPKGISPIFFEVLESYRWPGNVRELFHALESAYASGIGSVLVPQHLPPEIRVHAAWTELDKSGKKNQPDAPAELPNFKEYRSAMTREYLRELVSRTDGDLKEACRISGFSRSRLYDLLKEYHIAV